MLDIDTGQNVETLYKMVQIKSGKRLEKFQSTNLEQTLKFHKWYTKRYKEGLLLEIIPQKKVYNWKEKRVDLTFE